MIDASRLKKTSQFTLALLLCALWLVVAAAVPATVAAQGVNGVVAMSGEPQRIGISPQLDSMRAVRGTNLVIQLATFGPGNAVFERFGHNALIVRDTATGESYAYNWGMFDFNQPNFVGRFLSGETRYWLAAFDADALLNAYREENRSIRVQRLALSPVQRGALYEYVQWNSQGENAFYRYDYYRDNCSTRVRDVLDFVLNGQLSTIMAVQGTGRSWRGETKRLLADHLSAYAGIQIALGRNADRTLTFWEEAFLPEHLAEAVRRSVILREDGRPARLIASDTLLFEASRGPLLSDPPERTPMALMAGLLLCGVFALLTDARNKFARVVLCSSVVAWYAACGIAGTALLLAATVTRHAAYMGANTSLFLANPLALLAMIVVPIALWRRKRTAVSLLVATAIALFSVLAVLGQLLPSYEQNSGDVIAFVVPVNLILALAVYRMRSGSETRISYVGHTGDVEVLDATAAQEEQGLSQPHSTTGEDPRV